MILLLMEALFYFYLFIFFGGGDLCMLFIELDKLKEHYHTLHILILFWISWFVYSW